MVIVQRKPHPVLATIHSFMKHNLTIQADFRYLQFIFWSNYSRHSSKRNVFRITHSYIFDYLNATLIMRNIWKAIQNFL